MQLDILLQSLKLLRVLYKTKKIFFFVCLNIYTKFILSVFITLILWMPFILI